MKFKCRAYAVLLITLLATEVVAASQSPLSSPSVTQTLTLQPNLISSSQNQEEIERVLKEKAGIRDLVKSEVNSTFGWTLGLLNLLITVLIAIPIVTGIALFLLRRSILDRLVSDIELELRQQLETAKQKMIELQKLLDQREIIIQQLSKILPKSEEEIVSPTAKQQIRYLAEQLEALQAIEPQLLSTANDYNLQGDGFLAGGRYLEAIDSYDKAIEVQPLSFEAWLGKGRALRNLRKYEEALEIYEKVTEVRPDDVNAWNAKGNTLNSLKHYQEALNCFEKSIQIDPSYYDPWVNRSRSLDALKRYGEAEASLNKAVEIAPDMPQAYQNKAFHYAELKNVDLAVENLRKAICLDLPSLGQGILSARFLDPIREDEQFKQLVRECSQ